MSAAAVSASDAAEWESAVKAAGGGDVYFDAGYHRANASEVNAEAVAYVFAEGEEVFLHPILVRPIEDSGFPGWSDFETVYGYSGPISSSERPEFLDRAWRGFSGWCEERRIIAGFIRFNPFLRNEQLVPAGCRVTSDRELVVVDLRGDRETLWKCYPSVQRNMVRKAQRSGLTCTEVPVTEGIARFREIYEASMVRIGASKFYLFSDRYYETLVDSLGDRLRLWAVRMNGRIAAAALFMLHKGRIHYHLAGSLPEARPVAANNLLLHSVIEWGSEHGFTSMLLGGGNTPSASDPLYSFKASISTGRLPFHTGRWVLNETVFSALCERWMDRNCCSQRPSYFLLYRMNGTS